MANKKIYRWIALGAAVLALLALIMMFIPTVKVRMSANEWKNFSSFSVAFGAVITTEYGVVSKFSFNVLGLFGIVFFIPGFILAIVAAAKSEGKKAISIVSAVFLILSAICMFCLLAVSKIRMTDGSRIVSRALNSKDFAETVKKVSGSVLYGVMALLSGVASIVSAVFNKN